jgi:hypothetical protein
VRELSVEDSSAQLGGDQDLAVDTDHETAAEPTTSIGKYLIEPAVRSPILCTKLLRILTVPRRTARTVQWMLSSPATWRLNVEAFRVALRSLPTS